MKKLLAVCLSAACALAVFGQMGTVPSGGGLAGSITNVLSVGAGVSLISSSNASTINLMSLTNNGSGIALNATSTNISIQFTGSLSNQLTQSTFSTTTNTVNTNGTNAAWVSASCYVESSATALGKMTLYIETNGGGAFIKWASASPALAHTNTWQLSGPVSPNSRWYYTNESALGGTATIVASTANIGTLLGAAAGGGYATNLFTDTNMFMQFSNAMIGNFRSYTNVGVDTNIFQGTTNAMIGNFTAYTNVGVDTNLFRGYTNLAVVKVSGTKLAYPIMLTNSFVTNADGSIKVSVTSVTGTLPVANGGTGNTVDPYARANHTGTQLLATISDAGTAAAQNVGAFVATTSGAATGLSSTNQTFNTAARQLLSYAAGPGTTNLLIDLSTGNSFRVNLTVDNTYILFTNIIGTNYEVTANIQFRQDSTGGHLVYFSATNCQFTGGIPPTITTNANVISALSVQNSAFTNGIAIGSYSLNLK